MLEELKDLEQEAMDNLDPETYDAIVSNVLSQEDDVDRGYFHQGSLFVVETIKTKLGKYIKTIPTNIIERGNSVSATLPILINDDTNNNPIKSGEKILISGFGVGLALSTCILEKK